MFSIPVERQLSGDERKLLKTYSANMESSSSLEALDTAKDSALNTVLIKEPDWLTHLHQGVKKHFEAALEKATYGSSIPSSPLNAYLAYIDVRYTGGRAIGHKSRMRKLEGLQALGLDIKAPHLDWLRQIESQMDIIKKANPKLKEITIYRYLMLGLDKDMPIKKFMELRDERSAKAFFDVELGDYMEWYLKSKLKFKDNLPDNHTAKKMSRVLSAWTETQPIDTDMLESLFNHFDIHPNHERFVETWVKNRFQEPAQKPPEDIADADNQLLTRPVLSMRM